MRALWNRFLDSLIGPVDNPLLGKSISNRLIARHCRRRGCQTCVPREGYYPGMPQSHCYYCGKKTGHAIGGLPEWDMPTGGYE